MCSARAGAIAVLGALALGSAVGRSDDGAKAAPPQQPGAGFLEFLGSVDRLSEVNPNYLSPPASPKAAKPPAANGTTAPITPPPQTASQSGDKNNG